LDYVKTQLGRRPYDIAIIAHAKFAKKAMVIKRIFPQVRLTLNECVHSKILLIDPQTVWVSSANFGSSKWHETSAGFHSKEAYTHYFNNSFMPLWELSHEVLL
jgi:hypothetical protein